MSGFMEALLKRRSVYALSGESTLPDDDIEDLLRVITKNMPSAFNMQSQRAVLLLGQSHKDLWGIVMETLRARVPADKFSRTEEKINSFAAGHGTVLYFDDGATTQKVMDENPKYAENFPPWVLQHGGMLQISVWMALAEAGMGASLQHYNPIIDDAVKERFGLPKEWKLLAQMPFGKPTAPAGDKTFMDIDEKFKRFD